MHAVECLQFLALGRVDTVELGGKGRLERGGDVFPVAPCALSDGGPVP